MWILLTLMAAFMQAGRNALQSQLTAYTSSLGVTLARFIWAGPMALCYLIILYLVAPADLPSPNWRAATFISVAVIMQILATALMAVLFARRNYAVGAGLAKTEALIAAVFGALFFATPLSLLGWLGVIIGGCAVLLLSSMGQWQRVSFTTLILGFGSGASFAVTSLSVREAALALNIAFPHNAAWVLVSVISLQTLLLMVYLNLRDKASLRALFEHRRLTLATSLLSCLGSIGWFSAMALTAVPYVKTLGQVEVIFMLLINHLWLKQALGRQHIIGLVMIAVAAGLVLVAP